MKSFVFQDYGYSALFTTRVAADEDAVSAMITVSDATGVVGHASVARRLSELQGAVEAVAKGTGVRCDVRTAALLVALDAAAPGVLLRDSVLIELDAEVRS